ncbi:MAG: RNA 2',3'-cyclic phosphodiesterase [Acidimicrobiia bacterium]|nr:RNA 2',3'-cyclic phosphodiesterase [Acidimicrobiia bacterium]
MKVFVGVDLSAEARAAIAASLSDVDMPGKPAPPKNWHITLRYIGAMDDVSVDRLLAGLDEAELGDPFALRVSGLGAFPKPARAAVLYVGLDAGSERLAALAETVQDVVDGIGLGREDRPFVGHVTLARIRPPVDVRRLIADGDLPPVPIPVDEVTVFESVQVADGTEYRPIERFLLRDDR